MNNITPILTVSLPAPLALVVLSVCSSKRRCKRNRCKCRKSRLPCTDICKYAQCKTNDYLVEDKDNVFEEKADHDYLIFFFVKIICCDYLVVKGYYLTKIPEIAEIAINSIFFKETFDRKSLLISVLHKLFQIKR